MPRFGRSINQIRNSTNKQKKLTQERFFQVVDDPELLRRITYEELKTLALAYPYAHNLRCLLAVKARQIDHPEALRNLATAAAYSLDRTKLFLLVAPQVIAPQQMLAPEEVLELKPIETVKRELEALTPVAREEKNIDNQLYIETPPPTPDPVPAPTLEDQGGLEPVLTPVVAEPSIEAAPVRNQTFLEWMGHFQPPMLDPTPPKPVLEKTVPVVTKPAYSDPDEDEQPEVETPKQPGIAQQLAERSVAENQDVISETLAKLYAKQGYRDKAAAMYARLALLFPEKSAYFAAEIDKLKK